MHTKSAQVEIQTILFLLPCNYSTGPECCGAIRKFLPFIWKMQLLIADPIIEAHLQLLSFLEKVDECIGMTFDTLSVHGKLKLKALYNVFGKLLSSLKQTFVRVSSWSLLTFSASDISAHSYNYIRFWD